MLVEIMGDCAKRLMINKGMARCCLIVSSCTDADRRFLSENCRACGAEETSETPHNEQERTYMRALSPTPKFCTTEDR